MLCGPSLCTVEKTSGDLWLRGCDFHSGIGGCSQLNLINLISVSLMAGFFFFSHPPPPYVLFHLVKQSPYHALSACGESAYLHEPAE